MALFSRRPKPAPDQPPAGEPAEPVEPDPVESGDAASLAETDAAASVSVSVSSFQGLGAQGAPARPSAPPKPPAAEDAPPATETVPGLRDNVLVREALAALPESPSAQDLIEVARQLLQGHLFLRVRGDVRTLLAEGKELPLAMATVGDRRFALAYSGGAALQDSVRADGDADTSAMGQPVLVVIKHVLVGSHDGLIIDHASERARAVLPRALLEKMVEKHDPSLTIKTLLAGERTAATAPAVAEALATAPLWLAVGQATDGRPGIAEARAVDGARYLEVFSHPLEVLATGRGDQPAPVTGAQLAKALRDEGLAGVMVDPRGPWVRLTKADLGPVLALAD